MPVLGALVEGLLGHRSIESACANASQGQYRSVVHVGEGLSLRSGEAFLGLLAPQSAAVSKVAVPALRNATPTFTEMDQSLGPGDVRTPEIDGINGCCAHQLGCRCPLLGRSRLRYFVGTDGGGLTQRTGVLCPVEFGWPVIPGWAI